MTGQELEQLTEEYVAQEYGCLGVKNRQYLIDDIIGFLEWLTKTHCIVSKEAILSQHAWYMQRMKEVSSTRQTNRAKAIALEAAFGTEIFTTHKPAEQ